MKYALTLALAVISFSTFAGPGQLRDSRGLEDPFYRWNARLVLPQGKPVAKENIAADWNFKDGTTAGITRFSGIGNPKVKDGVLNFTTAKKAFFYWGDHFNDPSIKGLEIGTNWSVDARYWFYRTWQVQVRLKQSLPESVWTVSAREAGEPPGLSKLKKKIKGTGWQTVTFSFRRIPGGRGWHNFRRHSLCIEPGKAGNKVEISWVKVSRPVYMLYVRKEFDLKKPVENARICLLPWGRYKLFVNGETAAAGAGTLVRRTYRVIDVAKYLKPGKNVIAYEDEAGSDAYRHRRLQQIDAVAMEGIIKFNDGSFKRIYTDGSWRGSFQAAKNWELPSFKADQWKPVKVVRDLTASILPGRGRAGYGHFIDPPYFGIINVKFPGKDTPDDTPMIFREKSKIKLQASLPETIKDRKLDYQLFNAFTNKQIKKGSLNADGQVYNYSAKLPAGVYNLKLTAKSGDKLLDTRWVELAVAGKIPQPEIPYNQVENAVKKSLITEINCAAKPEPGTYIEHPYQKAKSRKIKKPSGPITKISDSNGIKVRETGKAFGEWFGYRIKIKHPWKPHIVEVIYPDDRKQDFAARAIEQHRGYYRNTFDVDGSRASIWIKNNPQLYPFTGKLQKGQFIYYPQDKQSAIEVINMGKEGKRSAIAKIRVYEVDELPAVKIPNVQPGMLMGSQTERSTLRLQTFYAGPEGQMFRCRYGTNLHKHFGFLKNWYIAIANQIRHMRYCGDNAFFCGFWMYNGTYWPSKLSYRAATPSYDNFALMFAMFEENGLTLVPWVEFCRSPEIMMLNKHTNKEVQQGAETPLIMSKDGGQTKYSANCNNVNPFYPAVRESMAKVLEEICERYSKYKSFKGIGLFTGGLCEPSLFLSRFAREWEEMLDYGWEDATVAQFEKDTGIKIPVDNKAPDRFKKRHDWVIRNKKSEWITWRCDKTKDVHRQLAGVIRKYKKDGKYMAFSGTGVPRPMAEYQVEKHQPIRETLRIMGSDPADLKPVPGLNFGWIYYLESFGGVHGAYNTGLFNTFNNSPAVNKLLDDGRDTACFLTVIWSEPDMTNSLHPDWIWKGRSQVNPNPWWGNPYYPEPFTDRLRQMTPSTMAYIFTDGHLYTAQHNLRRPFATAYRSIPAGNYRTLSKNGLDKNLLVREAVIDGKRYCYVVNPAWWKIKTKLRFSGKGELRDLIADESVRLAGNELPLKLNGYAVKVYAMPVSLNITGAETMTEPVAKEWLKPKIELLGYLEKSGPAETIKPFGFAEAPEKTWKRMKIIMELYDSGDYFRAMRMLRNPQVIKLLEFLQLKQTADRKPKKPASSSYRVIIGSEKPYRDSEGRTWLPDQNYQYGLNNYGYCGEQGIAIHRGSLPIAGTKDLEIYRTERAKFEGYRFKVPNGKYDLKMHYVECFKMTPGRTFDITIEGKPAIRNFDLAAEAKKFRTAFVKKIDNIEVKDGELTIDFAPLPMVRLHGIEVTPSSKS